MAESGLSGAGGIFGAAMSVNISQFVSAAGCIIYALIKYKFLRPKKRILNCLGHSAGNI